MTHECSDKGIIHILRTLEFIYSFTSMRKIKSHLKIAVKFACVNWPLVSSKSATPQLVCGVHTNIAFV